MLAAAPVNSLPGERSGSSACERCNQAIDARHFDVAGFADLPARGREALLASVELGPQYCGVLEYFSQYTDKQARDAAAVETPGLQWLILVNRQVLDPYVKLEHIANPWGFGSFQLQLRLPEGATLELRVRRSLGAIDLDGLTRLGGRLAGRSWYDTRFGALRRSGHAP